MNKEFEILNTKLNAIFEEIMWLRYDFQREKYEKETSRNSRNKRNRWSY